MTYMAATLGLLAGIATVLSSGLAQSADPITFQLGYIEPVMSRAGRPTQVIVLIGNTGVAVPGLKAQILLPASVTQNDAQPILPVTLAANATTTLTWNVTAATATTGQARVSLLQGANTLLNATFPVAWSPAQPLTEANYAPSPLLADSGQYLVGAMACNLWNTPDRWDPIKLYPDLKPVLGWYQEGQPAEMDWEIKYLLEHGISFVMPCWFRDKNNLGKTPIQGLYDHWIKALPACRYGARMKFAIMWENVNPVACGVSGLSDLMDNLLPYWIENYFKKPNYLVLDNKPVLAIFGIDKFISDLGGEANATEAIARMRAACQQAGFSGLTLLGEWVQTPSAPNPQFKTIGLDYGFAYHWPTFSGLLPPGQFPNTPGVLTAQQTCWDQSWAHESVPNLITCSMGWDDRPWGGGGIQWRLTPAQYRTLLQAAKTRLDQRPAGNLASRLVLLDNWNEFGEGHFIMPTRQYRFGYLDAVRDVFTSAPPDHRDLAPEDLTPIRSAANPVSLTKDM